MKKDKAPIKEIKESTPDIFRLRSLDKESLLALIRLSESHDGKIFIKLLDGYVRTRMAEVFYDRDYSDLNLHAVRNSFTKGRAAFAGEIKFLFKYAGRELAKREG